MLRQPHAVVRVASGEIQVLSVLRRRSRIEAGVPEVETSQDGLTIFIPDDECEADRLSYDARVKAHNLEKNQTRWIIEREGARHSGCWFATHRVHYLHASDALKAAGQCVR